MLRAHQDYDPLRFLESVALYLFILLSFPRVDEEAAVLVTNPSIS